MRIYIMVSDDIILKRAFFIDYCNGAAPTVCGVAEIRRKSPRKLEGLTI